MGLQNIQEGSFDRVIYCLFASCEERIINGDDPFLSLISLKTWKYSNNVYPGSALQL